MMVGGIAALGMLFVLAVLVGGLRVAQGPVSRGRLERLARRQRLALTPANAPLVVRSLALTRRWRALGLSTGLAAGLLWALRDGSLTLNFLAGFLGWFAGAVVAEWRLAGPSPAEPRRSASLEPRTMSGYLRPASAALLALVLAALLVAVVGTSAVAGRQQGQVRMEAVAWLLAALGGLALVALTLRRVVTRSQPPAAPDVIAADDALRARAANVLAGSAVAAAGVPTAGVLELLGRVVADDGTWATAGLWVMLLELLAGYLVATWTSPARTKGPADLEGAAR